MFVACPHCQQPVSVDDTLVGQVVACPKCQIRFQTPSTTSQPAITISSPPESHPRSGMKRRRRGSILDFKTFVTPNAVQAVWVASLVLAGVAVVLLPIWLVMMPPTGGELQVDAHCTWEGKTAEVTATNSGGGTAEPVTVLVDLPEAATVASATTAAGTTDITSQPGGLKQLRWQIPYLEAGGREQLILEMASENTPPLEVNCISGRSMFSAETVARLGAIVVVIAACVFFLVGVRLGLEAILILFRSEEHLRQLRKKMCHE